MTRAARNNNEPDASKQPLRSPGLIATTGLAGHRTSLFHHVIRLLKRRRAPWVLLENVKGILSECGDEGDAREKGHIRAPIAEVFEELEQLGYNIASRLVHLCGYGLPHTRERVIILASLHGDPRDVLLGQQGKGLGGPGATRVCRGECVRTYGRVCFNCFQNDRNPSDALSPSGSEAPLRPKRGICIDLAEKRSSPREDMVPTLTQVNSSRMCLIQYPASQSDVQPRPRYLTVDNVETLFGLPPGWTAEPTKVTVDASLPRGVFS